MIKLVLVRHGESVWNRKNLFTGWTDVGLTGKGVAEAEKAGQILKKKGYKFDVAFTSLMKKATKTLGIVLHEMKLGNIPVHKSWRLNERHYGALQGLNKAETAKKFGEKQVLLWRRSYSVRPPSLKKTDKRYPGRDPLYKGLSKKNIPLAESLKDTVKRVIPYWKQAIVPEIKKGRMVIIAAHGNSLRALVKNLDKISDKKIVSLNIPTGIPLVYELNNNLEPIKHYYLASAVEVKKAIAKIAAQGKSRKK